MRTLDIALLATLAATPVSAQVIVTSSTVMERRVLPGETYAGTITVRNPTSRVLEARLFQADYQFDAEGVSRFDAPGSHARSNARWIGSLPQSVVIPAGQSVQVPFKVAVPRSDSLSGSYWSVVMVETAQRSSPMLQAGLQRDSTKIRASVRYAVQVATHIGERGAMKLSLAHVHTSVDSVGRPQLEVDVANAGEQALRPAMTLELYDARGQLVLRQKDQRGLIYPGTAARQRFAFAGLARGDYTAMVLADAGGADVFGVQVRLKY